MVTISEIKAASILVPQKGGSLAGSYDFSLNPYAGCAFQCSYCYVPKFPNEKHHFSEWGNWLQVKVNAPQLIRKERMRIFGSRIFFGSATDPYQYAELKYRLSRRCLTELLRYQPKKLMVHTRSHLILEDIELLKPSIISIQRRLQLIRKLHEHGIATHVSMAPLLPCDPERLVRLVSPYINKIWIGQMNYPEINNRLHLLQKYESFFADNNYRATISLIQQLFRKHLTISS